MTFWNMTDPSLEALKVAIVLVMLVYTSILDVKYREVEPRVWLVFGLLLSAITSYEIYQLAAVGVNPFTLAFYLLISVGLTSAVAFAFAYFELMGGADFFALLVISLAHPWKPFNALLNVMPLFPLSMLANSALLSLTPGAYNLAYNLALRRDAIGGLSSLKPYRRLLVLVAGRPMRVSEFLRTKFTYLMEEFRVERGRIRREIRLGFRVSEEPSEDREKVRRMLERGLLSLSDYVWTTEGLPMLVFILAGYLLTLTLGDLVIYAIVLSIENIRV